MTYLAGICSQAIIASVSQSVELRPALDMLTTPWSRLELLIMPARFFISTSNEQLPWNSTEKYPVMSVKVLPRAGIFK